MRWLLGALMFAACARTAAPPTLHDVAWLAGTWHADALDAHWQEVAGALYGVALSAGDTFEINVIDDSDDDGKPAPLSLFSIEAAGSPLQATVVAADARHAEWRDAQRRDVLVTRTARGWRGEFRVPGQAPIGFDVVPGQLAAAPELEAADRQFAADTRARGADGWTAWFAPDGQQWAGGARVAGSGAIRDHIAGTLAHGQLAWEPVASGKRGALGYTLGTWTFTASGSGETARGSYCTVWRQQPDGTWRAALDLGRPAT